MDSMNMPSKVMQSTQAINDVSTMTSQSTMGIRIIGLLQGICSVLIFSAKAYACLIPPSNKGISDCP